MRETNAQFEIRGAAGASAGFALAGTAVWLGFDPSVRIEVTEAPPEKAWGRIDFRNGRFYFFDLAPDQLFVLNGRAVESSQGEALAAGDVLRVAGHELKLEPSGARLLLEIDSKQGTSGSQQSTISPGPAGATSVEAVDALREFWEKRSRDKIAQPSPLHPQEPPRPGKARFGWGPTGDLKRPWPMAVLAWAVILVVLLSVGAAVLYSRAFSPGAISSPHTRRALERGSAIANRANANSCTTCHSLTKPMDTQCAACHQTAAFAANITGIDAHTRAGIGCVSCHTEHQGEGFSNVRSALVSCAKCHDDRNPNAYAGRRVSTPHGGVLGYPVVNGAWKWAGLSASEWAAKPDAASPAMQAAAQRQTGESDDDWRRRQFHALHLNRVRLADTGLSGDANGMLSCSSCHRSLAPADKVTPATTCGKCHNGESGALDNLSRPVVAAGAPNCVSCHAPHAKAPDHWNAKLFSPQR